MKTPDLRPPRPWSLHFVAAWFDLWAGVYFDRKRRRLYVLPVPCLGLWIQLPPARHRLDKLAAREMERARREGEKSRRVPGLIELRERETDYILRGLRENAAAGKVRVTHGPLVMRKRRDRWPGLR